MGGNLAHWLGGYIITHPSLLVLGDSQEKKMTCTKNKYLTKEYAEAEIQRIRRFKKGRDADLRAYFHVECLSWHITSKPDKLVKKIEKLLGEVQSLKQEISALKADNNSLKQGLLKTDPTVISLREKLKEQQSRINRLLRDNHELVSKILK